MKSIFLQKYNGRDSEVSLSLMSFKFPNDTLDLNFYQGRKLIYMLQIDDCFLERIASDQPYSLGILHYSLKLLRFSRCKINEIMNDSIYTLKQSLNEIEFFNVDIGRLDPDFFRLSVTEMRAMSFDKLPLEYSLNNIVEASDTIFLERLYIRSTSPKFHLLAAANFSKYRLINHIDLGECGIRTIEMNTFDYVSKTLEKLSLSGNELTTLDFKMFYRFVQNIPRKEFYIDLNKNPLECSSSFHEFKNILQWVYLSVGSGSLNYILKCVGDPSNQTEMEPFNSPESQPIHLKIFYLNATYFGKENVNYPKFVIKLNETSESVAIRTATGGKYRLVVHILIDPSTYNSKWGYSLQKCPVNAFVRLATRCFLLSRPTEQIPLTVIDVMSDGKPLHLQFCVNYVSANPKKMWPLHCITVSQNLMRDSRYNLIYIASATCAGLSIFSLLFLFYGICYCFSHEEPVEERREDSFWSSTASEINDYESIRYCYDECNSLGYIEIQ